MSLPACLVTSSPSFDEPQRTPPFLMAQTASPDLRRIKVIDLFKFKPSGTHADFSAGVRSEDAGSSVVGRLVLDYGVRGDDGRPYVAVLQEGTLLPPATLDDPPRTLTAQWFPKTTLGCHTVTLFATHAIDLTTGCPADAADFDLITWTVWVCDSGPGECCDPNSPEAEGGCPDFQCPAAQEDVGCGIPQSNVTSLAPFEGDLHPATGGVQ
jgi:hypothetical protein